MSERGYIPPKDDSERMLVRRIGEMAQAVAARGGVRQTAFLSDREQALAYAALAPLRFESYVLDGGYPEAERRILCLYQDVPPQAPLTETLFIETPQAERPLTHRDYLGALLSLGIKRECLGDILPCPNGAYVFALPRIAPLLLEDLTSVGRCAARVRTASAEALPPIPQPEEKTASVASLRLDAVLAAMLHVSRAEATRLIQGGAVEVNHVPMASAHSEVYENDRFSVRGYGKYRLCGTGARSRKGRTFVSYLEY